MRIVVGLLAVLGLTAGACGSSGNGSASASRAPAIRSTTAQASAGGGAAAAASTAGVPRFAHVVVVVEENHAGGEIIGNSAAPFMNSLARSGALFTRSYAITHPSYPNYLALFSGSTHGIRNDSCPHYYSSGNLGAQLRAKGFSFGGYADGLPSTGYRGCNYGSYGRRHAPWVDFTTLPRSLSRPMTAFPTDFRRLPRLSFVIPNVQHDMHNGTIRQADDWLRSKLARYVSWARTHNSLLVLTWDEDDFTAGNHIATIFTGARVKAGRYGTRIDHYRVLRTLEASFGLRPLGHAADRVPITGVWTG